MAEGIGEKGSLQESDGRLQTGEDEEKVRVSFCVFLGLELGQKTLA